MKQIETEIIIEATVEKVWQVLTDFKNHQKWNPFIQSISGSKKEGEKLTVYINPPGSKGMIFRPRIIKFVPGREFRWKGKLGMPGIFDGEHYFLLESVNNNNTRFIHGEKFSGLLIPFMGNTLKKTREGFGLMNKSLKEECERGKKIVKIKKRVR